MSSTSSLAPLGNTNKISSARSPARGPGIATSRSAHVSFASPPTFEHLHKILGGKASDKQTVSVTNAGKRPITRLTLAVPHSANLVHHAAFVEERLAPGETKMLNFRVNDEAPSKLN